MITQIWRLYTERLSARASTPRNPGAAAQLADVEPTGPGVALQQDRQSAVAEEFIKLLLADPDLLDTEFAEIIAASWPGLDTSRRQAEPPAAPPAPRRCRTASDQQLVSRPRCPGQGGWGRQRSPPVRAACP